MHGVVLPCCINIFCDHTLKYRNIFFLACRSLVIFQINFELYLDLIFQDAIDNLNQIRAVFEDVIGHLQITKKNIIFFFSHTFKVFHYISPIHFGTVLKSISTKVYHYLNERKMDWTVIYYVGNNNTGYETVRNMNTPKVRKRPRWCKGMKLSYGTLEALA